MAYMRTNVATLSICALFNDTVNTPDYIAFSKGLANN